MKDVKNRGKFYGKKCDVSNKEQVKMLFAWIKDTFKTIHILVNNAGILRMNSLIGKESNTKFCKKTDI